MNELNDQEIFDKVVAHLRKQGKPSAAYIGFPYKSCLYRGPEGAMCAVGCLIPDDMYDESMEGNDLYSLPDDVLDYLGEHNLHLLDGLQAAHDMWAEQDTSNMHVLESRLKGVARFFNLNYTPPA